MEKSYRIIFHIDLNAFFASCEIAEDPSLRDVPVGIGGTNGRGVLTTANYKAREYGVHSAMSVIEAKRLCPNLIVLPVNFDLYHRYSNKFFSVLHEYSDTLEKGSIDEGYLDMTDQGHDKHPVEIAKEIQSRLLQEHKLPVSIGIAPNMFLAKMASDMKKPLGITILRKRNVKEKMWPLSIDEMYGLGKKTTPNLKRLGIETIGDLIQYDNARKLELVLGNRTEEFLRKARGYDDKVVDPNRHIEMKSIGNSSTYQQNIQTFQEALSKLKKLTNKVVNRLEEDESVAKTISIQVRYPDFKQITRSETLETHTDSFLDIYQVVERLFDINYDDKPIRLLGVSVSNLIPKQDHVLQLSIFKQTKQQPTDDVVTKMLEEINQVYGKQIIQKGITDDSTSSNNQ